jgi:DNA-binding NtrC family response regulator
VTRKRHVMVVDDEPNIGRSLRLILEGEGYRVTVCESVAALARMRNQPGADVSARRAPARRQRHRPARARQDDDRAVAVMIRARHDRRRGRGDRAGAFDFLEKPLARPRAAR